MIEVWIFPGTGDDVPSLSPFCMKALTYLSMTGREYEVVNGDPRKAPTKKLPAIVDDGELVGDTELIREHLVAKYGDPLDGELTPEQHALGRLLQRTCEEALYFVMLWSRWVDEASWPHMRPLLDPLMPPVIGGLIASMKIG